jgi:hypothetical protein
MTLIRDVALAELVRLKKLFICWVCGYISNIEKQHYQDGCINCLEKKE